MDDCATGAPRISRRSLGALGSLALLGACSRPQGDAAPSSTVDSVAPGPSAPSTSITLTPTATPSRPGVQGWSRQQVAARWDNHRPRQWSETATGVVQRMDTHDPVVALTFDLCGGPHPNSHGNGYDAALIQLLQAHRAPATLFLNSRWISANRALAEKLVADPLFEIGNHGTRHLPMSVTGRSAYGEKGTTSPAQVYDEVAGNTQLLTEMMGHPPLWFRGGTAWYDEIAVAIIGELKQRVIGFAVNGDAGTTYSVKQVARALGSVRGGDIVISHANRPEHSTAEGYAAALPQLLRRYRAVRLSSHLKPIH